MKKIKLAAALGVAATALAMGATAASAHTLTLPPVTYHATTYLADRPDSGNGTPEYWADDYMNRSLAITLAGNNGLTGAAEVWDYTATVTDKGYFTAIKGVQTPNQAAPYTGDVIKSDASGPMQGYADFSFTATSLPDSTPNLGVVTYENDHGVPATDSTSTWYELAFPGGTTFGGAGIGDWSWSYHATVKTTTLKPYWSWTYKHHHWVRVLRWLPVTHYSNQHWVDAYNNNYGDAAGDGNISG